MIDIFYVKKRKQKAQQQRKRRTQLEKFHRRYKIQQGDEESSDKQQIQWPVLNLLHCQKNLQT